jgi:hypothetical protein
VFPSPPPRAGKRNRADGNRPKSAAHCASSDLPASREAPGQNRRSMFAGAGCWQVFGLVSVPGLTGGLLSTASQSRRTSARRGGRSHIPLRGSPGFTPGSLLVPGQGLGTNTRAKVPAARRFVNALVSTWAILEDQIAIGASGETLREEPARPVPADRLLAGVARRLRGLSGCVTRTKVVETNPPRVLARNQNSVAPASPALTLARRRPRRSRSGRSKTAQLETSAGERPRLR